MRVLGLLSGGELLVLVLSAVTEAVPGTPGNNEPAVAAAAQKQTAAADSAQVTGFEWQRGDGTVALLHEGTAVWRFHYGRDAAKPFFHPLTLVGGKAVTWQSPPDHPWHLGLWFSWKYLNKVNYWEADRKTGKSPGETRVTGSRVTTGNDYSARIALDIAYAPTGQHTVLAERRVMTVSAPDRRGGYTIDWRATFTAGNRDVVFDRTPLPGEKGGKMFGGYAGLSLRTAAEFRNWVVAATSDPGPEMNDRRRFRAAAVDFSGTTGGQEVGVAFFDDRQNINAPSPWYVITNPRVPFGYVNAAVILYGPYTLPAGKSMTLHYCIVIHPGRWNKVQLSR